MNTNEDFLDFEGFLRAGVNEALRDEQWPTFLSWTRTHLDDFAPPRSPVRGDEDLRRALSFALARTLWNVLPLARRVPAGAHPGGGAQ